MLQCWQIQHRMHLDGALLAGDLGCFPEDSSFDKATRRWIACDPEEAGFSRYFMRPKAEIEAVFSGPLEHGAFAIVRCPIVFVAGNHESFAYLAECETTAPLPGAPRETFSVDCYRKIHCLRNGAVTTLTGADGMSLRVGGLWGVENAREGSPRKLSKSAAERLCDKGANSFDLLLTHDAPGHSYTGRTGSETISGVLATCAPPLHLFGHVHPLNGTHEYHHESIPTRSWIFEDAGFGRDCNGSLEGAMGVLTGSKAAGTRSWDVTVVKEEWLTRMRHRTWHHVWP